MSKIPPITLITLQVDEYEELVRACEKAESQMDELAQVKLALKHAAPLIQKAAGLTSQRETLISLYEQISKVSMERDRYRARVNDLEAALDDLKMHGTPIMVDWVSVPVCEWVQAFKRIGWEER